MKNLFDFSETAQVLHLITHKVVTTFVEQHQTDAILDFKTMYNKLYNGYPIYIAVRRTGFDVMERFNTDYKIPQKYITNDDEFEVIRPFAVKSLGANAYIKIYPNERKVDIMFVTNYNETELGQIKYALLGLEPMVGVNFVEKFGE